MHKFLPIASAFLGRFISAAGVFALSALLTRNLSLQQSGEFFTAFIALMGASVILQAGLNLLLIRKIAKAINQNNHDSVNTAAPYFATVLFLSSIGALISYTLLPLFNLAEGALGWLWLPLIPTTLVGMIGSNFKALRQPGWGGLWETGVISALTFLVLLFYQPTTALETWFVLCAVAWSACAIAIIQLTFKGLPTLKHFSPSFGLVVEARRLALIAILSYAAQWGGVLIAAAILDTESTAILNALFRVLAPIQFVVLTIDYYLAPKFATCDWNARTHLHRIGSFAGVILATPYALCFLIAPDFFMTLIFGTELQDQAQNLAIILIGAVIQTAMGPNGILLNMTGKEQANLNALLISTTIYALGTTAFAPYFGLTGFILVYTISTLIRAFYLRRFAKSSLKSNTNPANP